MKSFFILFFIIILYFPETGFSNPLSGINQDTEKKIDITSNTLRLIPKDNKAIFKDNVVATQDKVKITSDVMNVYYHDEENKKKYGNTISLIETEGNVVLKAPAKTAKSEKGRFDVDKNIIVLSKNVRLEQENSTVTGERLIHDTITNKSYIFSKKDVETGMSEKERIKQIIEKRKNTIIITPKTPTN